MIFTNIYMYKSIKNFIRKPDGSGYFVGLAIYLLLLIIMPKYEIFGYLAASLSVLLKLLPGLIPLAPLWHAGEIIIMRLFIR